MADSGATVRKYWFPIVLLLILAPMAVTAPHVILDSDNPEGSIEAPLTSTSSDGFLLVVLDGVGDNFLLDPNMMPELNYRKEQTAVLSLRTGPLTLSATCISELMTGVPNSPIDGLRNFDLEHPGGADPWILAAADEDYSVGMVGSYVMGNLYDEMDGIEFIDTFQGHSDYYNGDEDTSEVLEQWLTEGEHNVIAAHFSGPDKVGHRWGTTSQEYYEKIRDIDIEVALLLKNVPESWTIVITADHGMTDVGSHGSAEEVTRQVGAFVSGPDIIRNSESSGYQRDIPALMTAVLDLPFPIQLHGRVNLDILDLPTGDLEAIERANWEAAYHRQLFVNELNGIDSNGLEIDDIDWSKISQEEVFSRDIDIALSIVNWIIITLLSAIAFGLISKKGLSNNRLMLLYSGLMCGFVVSHTTLWYSAMIPRGIGAACAVWLVAWSLGGYSQVGKNRTVMPESVSRVIENLVLIFGSFRGWAGLVLVLLLIFGTLTQAVVAGCLIWAVAWSWGCGSGLIEHAPGKWPKYAPWLLAFAAFTFGSIRLWFALIPFLFIVARHNFERSQQGLGKIDRLPIILLSVLLFAAVTLVHRRIIGTHVILDLVEIGWSSSLLILFFSATLLTLSAFISVTCIERQLDIRKSVIFSGWLLVCFVVSGLAITFLDRVFLLFILLLYAASAWGWIDETEERLPKGLILVAISTQLLLTWGVWASSATLLLLSCIGHYWESIRERIDWNAISIQKPRPAIALAVIPWVSWILWWTLMGQVNGIQTCFEGICPHPRELDPGSIIVKGGYFGAREDPSTMWMTLMVASPLVVASTLIFYELKKRGLTLKPYIIAQTLLILGCMNVLAFSPQYPRLVFGLTWNIFFAFLQICFALLAIFLFYIKTEYSEKLLALVSQMKSKNNQSFSES